VTDPDWRHLLDALGAHGTVSEPVPGRVAWTRDGAMVEIVMTPDDWSGWSRTVMGNVDVTADLVLADVQQAVVAGTPYLVFDTYELHPSATPESPLLAEREADEQRVARILRDKPGAQVEWRAYSPVDDEPT
jgi:hypothetical protein